MIPLKKGYIYFQDRKVLPDEYYIILKLENMIRLS